MIVICGLFAFMYVAAVSYIYLLWSEKKNDSEGELIMFKEGDVVRWFLNPHQYVLGVVVEVCGDGTYWVEHSNRQQRRYKESELMHDKNAGGKGDNYDRAGSKADM